MGIMTTFQRLSIAVVGTAALVLLAACSAGDSGESTTPPATPSTTRPSAITPTAVGTPVGGGVYEPGTRVGVPVVDTLLTAVEAQDTSALLGQTHYHAVPCHPAVDSVLPECPDGAAEGTPVESALHAACERNWVAKTVVESEADDFTRYLEEPLGIHAVVELGPPDRPVAEGGDPSAEYLVVLGVRGQPDGLGRAFMLDSQGVVRFKLGCGETARDLLAAAQQSGRVTGILLSPRDG
jgi:hypothetical protein